MTTQKERDYIAQYKNPDLCAKWNNNIPADNLWHMNLGTDSQILDELCNYFLFLPREDITGVMYTIGEGDYEEVYVTESSRPYFVGAIYHPLDYYLED
jgi:hypothetical protein